MSAKNEYQTLFWVPMLFQTAKNAESLIEEMLTMISDFQDEEAASFAPVKRASMLDSNKKVAKRRQQILGEMMDSEVVTTRVDVVLKSESTKLTLLTVLRSHFLFSQLRDYELEDVIDQMQEQEIDVDEVIIEEGEAGDLYYILEEGECEIFKGGMSVGTMGSESSFGDLALMYNSPRAATIVSRTPCVLWTLGRDFFRQAMVTSSSNQNVQLSAFLSRITFFQSLGLQSLNQLARSLQKQTFEDGDYIIKQGDIGNQFYIIRKGKVRVSKADDLGNEKFLIELFEGEVFGELALIKKEPRKANIVADGPVECYYLESADFYSMLGEFVDQFSKINEFRVVRSAKVFSQLNDFRLKELISKFTYYRVVSNQRTVCGIGEIFITIDGEFLGSNGVTYSSDALMEIGTLEEGADQVAGALTAISDEGVLGSITRELLLEAQQMSNEDTDARKRHNSVLSSSTSTSGRSGGRNSMIMNNTSDTGDKDGMYNSLTMTGGSAGSAMDTTDDLDDGENGENVILEAAAKRQATANARRQSLANFICHSLEGLDLIQPLGKGTFGNVYLSRQRNTNKLMALKCLDKKALVEGGQHKYVRREIIALQNFQHPFLAEYYGVVLTPRKIFLLLEFISGGELWSYIYDEGVHHQKARGKFGGIDLKESTLYAASVLLALEHVHDLGYSYRDLKPENLLIANDGFIKLVDFGFAKQVPFLNKTKVVQYRTFTLCGTPEYMAPELVLTQGHDKSADYWAFGILLYELICGRTPFDSNNQHRIFEKIVHSQKHLEFPVKFDPHCKSLIRRLLHPNAALRIGALQNGIDDIKTHAFFTTQSIDFGLLMAKEVEMPFVPPPFEEGASVTQLDIDPVDLEFETTIRVDDDYDTYFESLNDPDLLEEQG